MRTHSLALLGALATLASCAVDPDGPAGLESGEPPIIIDPGTEENWQTAFKAAAATHDVPVDLLEAISLVETNMQMVDGHEEFEGRPVVVGMMGLKGAVLDRGLELTGQTLEQVRTDRLANIATAAAWLSERAEELGIDRSRLEAWAPVVADYSGIELEEGRAAYVHDDVYGKLATGWELEGQFVKARDILPDLPRPEPVAYSGTGDRSYAVWRPSPNHSSRPSGAVGDVSMVVIHSCEGSYSGCWSWLANTASGASAHYVVNESGSEVTQLVLESRRAWHVSATYDCARNSNQECGLNGRGTNDFSVGIEHAGFASQSSWNANLLSVSAQLTCDITADHGIPRDAYHIVSHGQLQPWNRTDPGPNWPWTSYINQVNSACNSTTPTPDPDPPGTGTAGSFIIDSNNSANDQANYYIEVSSNWISSQNVAGYYNTGYWAAPTAPISDGARFHFYVGADTCYDVDAWWTSAFDRSPSAPFIAYDGDGNELGRTSKNQQSGGGQWNNLGDWIFTPGWNQVLLSRWTGSGYYVIADALRLTPDDDCAGWCGGDTDGDGTDDCNDQCPTDAGKTSPGQCGCGTADTDSDGDGSANCIETCDNDPNKTSPGICGCGTADTDSDGDGAANCNETCDTDPNKTAPGVCGCGTPDVDLDGDGAYDCLDQCPNDPAKSAPGVCGCGVPDIDSDGDGAYDCQESCPTDPAKTSPGTCGCGTPDIDTDGDGALDCIESCPTDPNKTVPGTCGCGVPDVDITGDGIPDCTICGDGLLQAPEVCDDGNDVSGDGCSSTCQLEALNLAPMSPGTAGMVNTLTAEGAAAGNDVWFLVGFGPGSTPLPGCPGVSVPVRNPVPLGVSQANASGEATYSRMVPATAAGRTVALIAVEPQRCQVSGVQVQAL